MKAEKRQELKIAKATAGPRGEGEDPDIAGIVPGPQPLREDQLTDDEEVTPET
jgi:hypothetical protein